MAENTSFLLALSTIFTGLAAIFLFALFFFEHPAKRWFVRHDKWLALAIALGGMIFSLFYSDILHFPPCNLCWYQRIALYPQVILLALAIWYKDKKVMRYIAWLSAIGAIFALYNHGLQMNWFSEGALCGSAGISCAKIYTLEFGFITIPFMAFVAFVFNFLLALHSLIAKED